MAITVLGEPLSRANRVYDNMRELFLPFVLRHLTSSPAFPLLVHILTSISTAALEAPLS
jgi:hypothetical protein